MGIESGSNVDPVHVERSRDISDFSGLISRDGEPGLADFVRFVAALPSPGMTDE